MSDSPLKLSCRGCGASLEYSASDQALKCQYCGTITEIPKEEDELPDAPGSIVPLTVDETRLTDAVYEHLASGKLTPDHLLEHATFTKKERFYVPAFCFYGTYDATWTASFGYDRTEHYTAYESRTENGHTRQVPVTKTKTVTDWRPANGTDTGKFVAYGYAGARLLQATVNVTPIVEGGHLPDMVPYDASYTTGIQVEEFSVPEGDVYRDRAKSQVNSIIDRSVEKHAQGDHQKDWHWTADVSKKTMTVLVPVCHATYEFEGRAYNVWISGADASELIADPLPVDAGRKKAMAWAWLPGCAALVSGAVAIFKFDSGWDLPLTVAAAGLMFGGLRNHFITQHSLKLRQSLLASRKAAASNTAGMSRAEQQALTDAAKRPNKPWLANTARDKVVLPLLTLFAVAVPFASFLVGRSGGDQTAMVDSPTAANQSQSQRSSPPAETKPAVPDAVPPTANQMAVPAPAPSASTETNATAAPTQPAASEASANDKFAPIVTMLKLAGAGDWNGVDEQFVAVKSQKVAYPSGDRKSARIANNEGLNAFKANDFATAISAFERGVNEDPSDIEVRNNLGYALMKAQRGQDAAQVLGLVLLQTPDRSSAWANLSETLSSDTGTSIAALKLAVRFSANRARTVTALRQVTETAPNEQFRQVAANVLGNIDSIPRNPSDHSAPEGAQGGGEPSAASPNVQVTAPQSSTTRSTARTQPAQGNDDLANAVRQMLAEGESCMAVKKYSCAITSASNALRVSPDNPAAMRLKSTAEAAQAEAMRNIDIK